MKIAITGHSIGIGKALFDSQDHAVHDVKGYSRRNGYNIDSKQGRRKLIDKIKDADILVNNAFSDDNPWAQIDLLFEIWEEWMGLDKKIINVSSGVTMKWQNAQDKSSRRHFKYRVVKRTLEDACEFLWNSAKRPAVSYLAPGLIIHKDNEFLQQKHLKDSQPMPMSTCVDSINQMIHSTDYRLQVVKFQANPK